MLSIGEFSKICEVSTKTLRYYDEIGLINPSEINPDNGYRYYSIKQLETMLFINRLKQYNLSLEQIRAILKSEEIHNEKLYLELYKKKENSKNKYRCIKNIEQPVLDFFPEYKIKRGEKTIQKVTIKHLLTMTAPYKYKYEPWTKICSSNDWTIAALDFLGGRKRLTGEFKYSTLGIHILTGILSKTSGLKAVDFANKFLFEPIGAQKHMNYLAETAEEHKHFTMSKEPRKNIWFCDPQGIGTAGYGLCFSAADMAKIGQLCLDRGYHDGKQIVSSEWIKEMTKPNYKCNEEFRNMSYGYLWWIIDENRPVYAAIGNSGNVIYVNPSKNIVTAVTSYFKPTIFDRVDFIQTYIEPFIS